MKVSVGNDEYSLTKNDEIQITDTTIFKYPNTGGCLLQTWVINCNDKISNGKIQNFIKSTKTNSPTGSSGATSLPPVGDSFLYIETSSNNHGNNVFVSFEPTDIIEIIDVTFYYNRFSILTNASLKSMVRFRIHLLLAVSFRSTRYNIHKNDRYSISSTLWTKLILKFFVKTILSN